jgi:hypothetical protein
VRVAGRVFIARNLVAVMMSRRGIGVALMPGSMLVIRPLHMGPRSPRMIPERHAKLGSDPGDPLQGNQQGHRERDEHSDEL